MFFNKKGEGASYMGSKTTDIILALAGLVVIGIVIIAVFNGGDFFNEIICKISVYFADQTHGLFPAVCYTGDKVIEEENKAKVMLEVAESMRKCWSMWGEGELNPEGKSWINDDFKCFKCDRLKFTDMKGSITYEEFVSFLQDSNNKVRGYDDTYWNYFNGNVVLAFKDKNDFNDMIKNNEGYAITFIEDVEENNLIRYGGGIGIGVAGGLIFCAFTGPGIPLCLSAVAVGAGGIGGGLLINDAEEMFSKWLKDAPDSDAIMLSKYDDIEYCSGYIT